MPSVLPDRPPDAQLLGYAALIDLYQLDGPPPRRLTAIASVARSTTHWQNGIEWLLPPRNSGLRPSRAPIEHLGLALKHEGTNFRVLSRLFVAAMEVVPPGLG